MMNKKSCLLYSLLCICVTNICVAQANNNANAIAVEISLSRSIRTNDDLKVKIKITNISDIPITIYKDLVQGDLNNPFANTVLVVEKKEGDRFIDYSKRSFYDAYPTEDTIDNIPKITVAPNDSLVNYCHADNEYQFETGVYRLKCLYKNNIRKNKTISSNWNYFKVVNHIYVKHYFESVSSSQTPIELALSLNKTDITVRDDLNASLKFKSKSPKIIILPARPIYGYTQREDGLFNLQLQKKIDEKFEDVMPHGTLDTPPCDLMDSLHNNDFRNYKLPIQAFYYFKKGQYRIRVKVVSALTNKDEVFYSNWVYFNCPKEIHR